MIDLFHTEDHINCVSTFQDLVSTPFHGDVNALCWKRELIGDFSEIIKQVSPKGNMEELGREQLCEIQLSKEGQLAREILLNDLKVLKSNGASPILNLIKCYDRDDSYPFFPTDVYSFHVDRSPVPTDTYLCTYQGAASEIVPNSQAIQKILIPEIRDELKKLYNGAEEGFESFLSEYFFDLHYQAAPNAQIVNLGIGNLWKLAVDYPERTTLPCVHRAPEEKNGQTRLMIIC